MVNFLIKLILIICISLIENGRLTVVMCSMILISQKISLQSYWMLLILLLLILHLLLEKYGLSACFNCWKCIRFGIITQSLLECSWKKVMLKMVNNIFFCISHIAYRGFTNYYCHVGSPRGKVIGTTVSENSDFLREMLNLSSTVSCYIYKFY